MKKLFHFLGSVYFAVPLIALATLFVIAGTLLESYSDSHLFAAKYTYNHPLFTGLLFLFFINILFAALRRWPFKVSHTPFLITHLGLLMILAGTMIKNQYGTQGSLIITEGSGSHELIFPNTQAIMVESFDGRKEFYKHDGAFVSENKNGKILNNRKKHNNQNIQSNQATHNNHQNQNHQNHSLKIQCTGYTPNCRELNEPWIKGDVAIISGLPPFPVGTPVKAQLTKNAIWNIIAIRSDDPEKTIHDHYLKDLNLSVKSIFNDEIYEGPWTEAVTWENGTVLLELELPLLRIYLDTDQPKQCLTLEILLSGPNSLSLNNKTTGYLSESPIDIKLTRIPTLLLVRDQKHNTHIAAFDAKGQIYRESFPADHIDTLAVYDEGFGGYSAVANIPFNEESENTTSKTPFEKLLYEELTRGENNPQELAPPLKCFYDACKKSGDNFASSCLEFLSLWNHTNTWIWPEDIRAPESLQKIFAQLKIASPEKEGCEWVAELFNKIDPKLRAGQSPEKIIKESGWPLTISQTDPLDLLNEITQQTYSIGSMLQVKKMTIRPEQLLSAYLRVYGIHLSTIKPPEFEQSTNSFLIESPLTKSFQNIEPLNKLEENKPRITLNLMEEEVEEEGEGESARKQIRAQEGGPKRNDTISLAYDKTGSSIKWPALGGRYLVRFQPYQEEIPYHVRLRQARQINYPGTNQPYSYEADLLIEDKKRGTITEKTISMNQVHETWDGYRFYLASISPSDETAVKQVQIVANHDPARYLLTYPGGVIVSLGIVLLFWWRGGSGRKGGRAKG